MRASMIQQSTVDCGTKAELGRRVVWWAYTGMSKGLSSERWEFCEQRCHSLTQMKYAAPTLQLLLPVYSDGSHFSLV